MNDRKNAPRVVEFFDRSLFTLANASLDAILLVDPQQSIVAVNPSASKMFGVMPSEVLGRPLSHLIVDGRPSPQGDWRELLDVAGATASPPTHRATVVGRRAGGDEFPAEASFSRIELAVAGASSPYLVAALRDLSAERHLEAEVATLRRRIRAVLDLAPVAMWIVEEDHLVFANRAARRLLGARADEDLVGEPVYALLHPDDHAAVRAHLAQALAGEATAQAVDVRVLRRDGQRRDVEITTAALPDHGKLAVQMMLSDVTEHRQRLHEHERHRRELRQLSTSVVDAREEERRRIARELHDELGQRLSALKMELASLRLPGTAPGKDRSLHAALQMVDETVAAVRRIAADLRPLMLDDLGLNAAIESLAREAARRMAIEVTVRLGDEDLPVTDGASIALYRMVQEALTNVSRHARATEVHVDLRPGRDEVVLTVQDNGVGFSERALQHEGRYGLLGIRERALALGGRLEIDNPPGGGGRITVRLPLKPVRTGPGGRRMKPPLPTTGLRVLLVDDHTIVREGLKRILESTNEGWSITEEGSGFQALERLQRAGFDLAIVDLSMPGMSGLELIGRIRQDFPQLPVLVLSMHAEEAYALRAFKAGANGYLTKDSAPDELTEAVRKVIHGGTYVTRSVAERVVQQLNGSVEVARHARLSNRELEVLRRIVAGQRSKEIAEALHLSAKTISTHKTRILEKLQLGSTAALVRYGMENGLAAGEAAAPRAPRDDWAPTTRPGDLE